jgi:Uma2 family endonuclease
MTHATQRTHAPLSVETFRAWAASRPDEEHWELIDGVPMMMTPPTRVHQRIASNLERLLNDALELHRPAPAAYQRIGVNLGPVVEYYDPEPDVAIVDADPGRDPRYSDRFYLAAEVVSDSDRTTVDTKRETYKRHPHCRCVLVIRQDQCHVGVDLRTDSGWHQKVLSHPDDALLLAEFGLQCSVRDLYKGTAQAQP